jgi:hypothetical protein
MIQNCNRTLRDSFAEGVKNPDRRSELLPKEKAMGLLPQSPA